MNAGIAQWAPVLGSWLVLASLASLVVALAAALLHRLARGAMPTRLIWAGALVGCALLSLSQPWRRTAASPAAPAAARAVALPVLPANADMDRRWIARTRDVLFDVQRATNGAVHVLSVRVATATRSLPHAVQWALLLTWPLATLGLLGVGLWSYRRQQVALRGAPVVNVGAVPVHVTPGTGPAVFGAWRPRIIVPAWLLQRAPEEQRLVVLHESAHIAARDPLLLLTACAVTALIPWNACAWYLLRRLRLSIELDCDARVLQTGASPRHYGALLIDLSAATSPAPLIGAPAFSHRASHLERRLRTMTSRPTSHRMSRRVAAAAVALVAAVAACGAELPTSAELQGLDVAAAEKRAFIVAPNMTAANYEVDGKGVTEKEAKALAAERIASIEIIKRDKKRSLVRIATQPAKAVAAAPSDSTAPRVLVAVRANGTGDSTRTLVMTGDSLRPTPAARTFEGLVILDGVPTKEAVMRTLDPSKIERVEVIKGAAGEKLYGPQGAKGVIVITTKK